MNKEDIYGINKWGNDILEIMDNGNIGLKNPFYPDNSPSDLIEIIKSLNERGISCPVLLRITDYLAFRIQQINNSFLNAIKEIGSVETKVFPSPVFISAILFLSKTNPPKSCTS